jgi:hypothetical protein
MGTGFLGAQEPGIYNEFQGKKIIKECVNIPSCPKNDKNGFPFLVNANPETSMCFVNLKKLEKHQQHSISCNKQSICLFRDSPQKYIV